MDSPYYFRKIPTCVIAKFTLYSSPMDLVPLDTQEPMEDNSYLSELAVFSRDREIERRLNNPKRKETMLDQVRKTDELIGGVPRLAVEADRNPWEFYKLRAKLEAAEKNKNFNLAVRVIAPGLPPTALDGEITDMEYEEVPAEPGPQKN